MREVEERREGQASNLKKLRTERFEKVVPVHSHIKVANNNYSKVMIGDNDSLKQLYRQSFGTYVNRLDKASGVREGFSTPRAAVFQPLEFKASTPKRRDNIEEVQVQFKERRSSITPEPSQFWS